jgi:MoaA/NifB/PqqE/SkfB family radical SAM enzyme
MGRQIKVDPYSIVLGLGRLYGTIPRFVPLLSDIALPPIFIVLELTYRCNLRCSFCYLRFPNANGSRNCGTDLSYAEIQDIAAQAPPRACFLLSGGEILLREDLPEILRAVSRKHPCHVFTNGTLITPAIAAQWVSLGLTSVAISVEGSKEVHDRIRGPGTFGRSVAGMQTLAESRARKGSRFPLLNLKTTITTENAGALSESIRVAEDSGADYCTFQVQNNSSRMGAFFAPKDLECSGGPAPFLGFPLEDLERELQRIAKISQKSRVRVRFLPDLPSKVILAHYSNLLDIRKHNCISPWTVMYISPSGYVYPCLNYYIGSVREQPLRKLWNSPRYRLFRKRILRNGLFPDCRGCCDLVLRKRSLRGNYTAAPVETIPQE